MRACVHVCMRAAHLPLNLIISLEAASADALAGTNARRLQQGAPSSSMQKLELIGNPEALAVSGSATWRSMLVRAWPGLYRLKVRVEPVLSAPYFGGAASTMDVVSVLFHPYMQTCIGHTVAPWHGYAWGIIVDDFFSRNLRWHALPGTWIQRAMAAQRLVAH